MLHQLGHLELEPLSHSHLLSLFFHKLHPPSKFQISPSSVHHQQNKTLDQNCPLSIQVVSRGRRSWQYEFNRTGHLPQSPGSHMHCHHAHTPCCTQKFRTPAASGDMEHSFYSSVRPPRERSSGDLPRPMEGKAVYQYSTSLPTNNFALKRSAPHHMG